MIPVIKVFLCLDMRRFRSNGVGDHQARLAIVGNFSCQGIRCRIFLYLNLDLMLLCLCRITVRRVISDSVFLTVCLREGVMINTCLSVSDLSEDSGCLFSTYSICCHARSIRSGRHRSGNGLSVLAIPCCVTSCRQRKGKAFFCSGPVAEVLGYLNRIRSHSRCISVGDRQTVMRIVIRRTVICIVIFDGRNSKLIIVVLRYDNRHRMRVSIIEDAVLVIVILLYVISVRTFLHKGNGLKGRCRYRFASLCGENILSVFFWKRSACRHCRDVERKLRIGKVIAIRFVCPAIEFLCDRDIRLNRSKRIGNYQRNCQIVCLLPIIGNFSDGKLVCCTFLDLYNCRVLLRVILNTGRCTLFLSNMIGIGASLLKGHAAKASCGTIGYGYRLLSICCICRHRCIFDRCQVKCKAACL